MALVERDNLTLLALAGGNPDTSGSSLSAVEIGERLEMGTDTMADRIAVLSTLSALEEDGLVTHQLDSDGTRLYSLTDDGHSRAVGKYEDLVGRTIEVRNESREEIPLGETDRYLPEPALVRALASMTDDGVLYLTDQFEPSFVDREAAFQRLDTHLADTHDGTGRAVLVAGEAGVGKTSLIEEWLEHADVQLLTGVCHGDTSEPFRPIRAAIEPILTDSPFDRPEVDLENATDLAQMRTSLFADLTDALLRSIDLPTPTVVYLDDLHNAGEPTLKLIDYLEDRLTEGPLLLVASSRLDSVPDDHPVITLAERWRNCTPHDVLELEAFGQEHTRSLVEHHLGTRSIPESFTDRLYEHTGGNALFVEETIAALQERGELVADHGLFPERLDVEMPDTVEAVIETRFDALDDDGSGVLSTAALLGEEVPVSDLETVLALDAATIREYLDLLVDVDVLQWVDDGKRVRFLSGLFRESVVDGLPADERTSHHLEIATALDDSQGGDPEPNRAATVAYHYERGRRTDRALECWLTAADHAESLYAHEVAREHYERALLLARDQEDDSQVLDILESIGTLSILLADHERACRSFEYVYDNAESVERKQLAATKISGHQVMIETDAQAALETIDAAMALGEGEEPSTEPECRLLLGLGFCYGRIGDQEAAERALKEAAALAEEIDDPILEGRALINLSGHRALRKWAAPAPEAATLGKRAVDRFEEAEDDPKLAGALNNLGLALLGPDHLTARDCFERSVEVSERLGDRTAAVQARGTMVSIDAWRCLNGLEDYQEVIAHLEDVVAEARSIGVERTAVINERMFGQLAWQYEYDYEAAVDWFKRSIAAFREHDVVRIALYTSCHLGAVHVDAGEFESAREPAEEAVTLGEQTQVPIFHSWAHRLQGEIAAHDGDLPTAIEEYERALEIAESIEAIQAEIVALAGLVDRYLQKGEIEVARTYGQTLTERVEDGREGIDMEPGAVNQFQALQKPVVEAHRSAGRLYRAQGLDTDALQTFQRGLTRARDQGDRLRECRLVFELARTHQQAGSDWQDVSTRIDEGVSLLEQLGAFAVPIEKRFREEITLLDV